MNRVPDYKEEESEFCCKWTGSDMESPTPLGDNRFPTWLRSNSCNLLEGEH